MYFVQISVEITLNINNFIQHCLYSDKTMCFCRADAAPKGTEEEEEEQEHIIAAVSNAQS